MLRHLLLCGLAELVLTARIIGHLTVMDISRQQRPEGYSGLLVIMLILLHCKYLHSRMEMSCFERVELINIQYTFNGKIPPLPVTVFIV